MRVTQRMMYNNFISNMQSTLGAYMESNIQGASQKKINRPSDDPAGMALVLNARRNIDCTTQFQRNVDTAEGWLKLADSTLTQVSTTITMVKELAEQAATGTMTAENRLQVATQLRQLFGQMLNLSNTQFEGKSIFAGHKYDAPAYGEALSVTTMDANLQNVNFDVTGKTDRSIMLVFNTSGRINSDAAQADNLDYQWSNDGGATWQTGTLAAGQNTVSMNGVTLNIPNGTSVTARNPNEDIGGKNGSMLYIRPTAVYNGDDQGAAPAATMQGTQAGLTANVQGKFATPVLIQTQSSVDLSTPGSALAYQYSTDNGLTWNVGTATVPDPANRSLTLNVGGASLTLDAQPPANPVIPNGASFNLEPRRADVMGGSPDLVPNVQGTFNSNVVVRLDSDVDVTGPGNVLNYSYSTDNGTTWIRASTQTPTPANNSVRLPVPGGYMDLNVPVFSADTTLRAGTQVIIHPDRADLNFEIMKDSYISVNSVGTNIFGGLYGGKPTPDGDQNLFEVIGNLIAYTENNNQQGVQECLAALTKAQQKVLTEDARIGGLENRLSLAKDVLSFEKLDQEERLSYTEEVDLMELLTKLAQQEMAYNTVLKSSSMIMQLNLTKFV